MIRGGRYRLRGSREVRRDERGFVLIAVLWLLVALTAVTLDVSIRTKVRRSAAVNMLDQRQARAAAMAGAEYARAHLTAAMLGRAEELRSEASNRRRGGRRAPSLDDLFENSDPAADPWRDPAGLMETEMALGDVEYRLDVRDAGARLNLNDATEEMLRAFFAQGLRVDYADADRITQAILDWRDEDDLPRIGGGEREQYIREEAAVLPANRPFDDVSELRFVMGMTDEVYAAAAPHLTVTSSGDVNVNVAPEPVLLALPGMTPEGAAVLIRLREGGVFPRSDRQLRDLLPAGAAAAIEAADEAFERRVTYATEEVEIVSEGRIEGSAVRVRIHTVVARSNAGAVVVWRKFD